jgi:hypothetical protein
MTNFAKVLDQLVTTTNRVLEAREENDPKTEAYYMGKLDTLKWVINNDIIYLTK